MKTTFFLARIPPNLPTFFRKGIQHNQFSVHLSTYSSLTPSKPNTGARQEFSMLLNTKFLRLFVIAYFSFKRLENPGQPLIL